MSSTGKHRRTGRARRFGLLATTALALAAQVAASEPSESGSEQISLDARAKTGIYRPLASPKRQPGVAVHRMDDIASGVRVLLPDLADSAFSVAVRRQPGLSLQARLMGALPSPAKVDAASGLITYSGALPNGAVVAHRLTRVGTEDFVWLPAAPASGEIRYQITLGSEIEGLRLVANSLELLDARGAPRLRVTRAVVVDARGTRRPAQLGVEGCVADTNSAPPWGRPPAAPGSPTCLLTVSLPASTVYPAVLDPAWELTGDTNVRRTNSVAVRLGDGRVLLAGSGSTNAGSTAEVYDPATGTWANTSEMQVRRDGGAAAALLADGRALITGGRTVNPTTSVVEPTASCEIWDPSTGLWSAAPDMSIPRSSHTASPLPNGYVLVAGTAGNALQSRTTELYDSTLQQWSAGPTMPSDRFDHTATELGDGSVLLSAGSTSGSSIVYSPNGNSFSTPAPMAGLRYDHQAARLGDGRVLVAGGLDLNSTVLSSVELYDPTAGQWSQGPPMSSPRTSAAAGLLGNGSVVVAGGDTEFAANETSTAELFNPAQNTWSALPDMSTPHSGPASAELLDGSVMVVGGLGGARATELLRLAGVGAACAACNDCQSGRCAGNACLDTPAANGTSCGCDAACESGHCVDGVCCDRACDGECVACTAQLKGAGSDGECAAVAAGSDPGGVCADRCGGVCGAPGQCLCAGSGPTCDGDHTVVEADGSTVDCSPYRCNAQGECGMTCSSAAECRTGAFCSAGRCVLGAAGGGSDEGGCGCRNGPRGKVPAPLWFAFLLPLVVTRRRR